ncbi:GNAT family N-acetyltransferase [Rhizobium sullae]|uniref:Acetyltransferase (GNAT) family protein n=1 Tax=Rhizobium sullae TaxID=50338 RepID=A0A4V2V8Q2_RHISU|nr:GNAT family N-acetyltransferase [Rhizobium sullae]TCU14125.1 acetyltransferase (GNAT) family protein [Rhizobium sullae]
MEPVDIPIVEIITDHPSSEHCAAITRTLREYNDANVGDIQDKPDFAILVRDPHTRDVLGGLYAVDGYGWAFIKYLVIPAAYRGTGLGTCLMVEAETIARERGYIGVWLDTFEFQARPFYEKLGYEIFGQLESGPGAIARYFLKKRFA